MRMRMRINKMAATVNKKVLYVGGLAEEVEEKILQAAFIPFGDIVDITIPLDYSTQKHRGFAFVEFGSVGETPASSACHHLFFLLLLLRLLQRMLLQPLTT